MSYAGRIGIDRARSKSTRSDFVSEVDLAAERAAIQLIRGRHPGHVILAEESSDGTARPVSSDPLWVIDPLDGTTNYLHGHPFYAAAVSVSLEGRTVAGAVTSSSTGDRWWAAEGLGAWRNGERIHVSRVKELGRSLVGTGFPFKALDQLPAYLRQFEQVLRGTSGIRRTGAASLDLAFLASGMLDAFWELHLEPWDFAAGQILIEEAGGVTARLDGTPLDLARGTVLAGNSPELLNGLRRLVEADPA